MKKKRYPLTKSSNLLIRQELIDYDYLKTLSDEELDYLEQFTSEWIMADFTTKEDRKHPIVKETKKRKTKKENIEVDIYKQDCEKRNNSRNRDAFTITKAHKILSYHLENPEENFDIRQKDDYENYLNRVIDLKARSEQRELTNEIENALEEKARQRVLLKKKNNIKRRGNKL